MSDREAVRLVYGRTEEVEDPLLMKLDEEFRARKGIFESFPMGVPGEAQRGGTGAEAEPTAADTEPPFDLQVVKPRAVDVRKFCQLVNKPVPPDIEAALGPRIPVLLYHGLTPFHRPGQKPLPVWGLGYEVQLEGGDASTVALEPDTRLLSLVKGKLEAQVGLSADGAMEVPSGTLQVINAVPGVTLQGARVHATSNAQFGLAIQFDLSVLEVQAGPVGAGGARWNLYQAHERLDRFQPLLHTLLVPAGTQRLNLVVKTWVRSRARWLGLIKARQWSPPEERFEVSLEGLKE
jgi:hypothetical protein